MKRYKWIWHEPSNVMAIADTRPGALPLITICEDVNMINPFFAYPYELLLQYYGWVEIGEI